MSYAAREMRGRGIALAFFGLVIAYGVYDCLRAKVSSFAYVTSIKNYQVGVGGHYHCRIEVQLPFEVLDHKPSAADERRLLRDATRIEVTLDHTCKDAAHTWVPARFDKNDRHHVQLDVAEGADTVSGIIGLLLGGLVLVAVVVPQLRKLVAWRRARRDRRQAEQRVPQARVVSDNTADAE